MKLEEKIVKSELFQDAKLCGPHPMVEIFLK